MNEPRLRFKGFRDEWQNKKFGNLASIVRGASPRPINDSKWFNSSSDIGWLRISDVTEQNGRVKKLNQHISKLGESKTRVLKEPHLLISIAATVGSPVINYTKTGVHDGFLIFKNPNFNKEFMFQWLLNFKPKWKKYGQPGSQLNLNSSIVNNQNINIPTYIEQQKIGSFFEKLDQLIQIQSDKLEHLKITKKGYLQKIFLSNVNISRFNFKTFYENWNKLKLKDICYSKSSKISLKNALKENNINNKYPIFDVSNLIGYLNGFDQKTKYISIIKDGSGVGKTRLRPEKSSVISTMNYIVPKENIDVYFLNYYFKVLNIKKYKLGTGIPHIYFKDYSKLDVSVPSFNEQKKIGQFLYKLDKQITLQQQKLDNLKQQKKAYLQKMFI